MNSKFLIVLVLLLSAAILAPSVIALLDLGSKTVLVLDHNEEEETEKTPNDSDQQQFLNHQKLEFSKLTISENSINTATFNRYYDSAIDIPLPPPRFTA